MRTILLSIACFYFIPFVSAREDERSLSLEDCIQIATDSSLQAFKAQNVFLSEYWEYRVYQSERLPAISFQFTPIQYNSDYTKRYDYLQNIEVYRLQQSISSSGGLSVSQNFEPTGGTFTLSSDLDYMRNFGENIRSQYSSVPVRLGYSQSLLGFNRFKWDKKIAPLKYQKAQKQFLYTRENISETAVNHFFDLAMAQSEYALAIENVASTDSLLLAGKERNRIATISQADLLTLRLDSINAENALENAITQLQKAEFAFISFFNLDRNSKMNIILPEDPQAMVISTEETLGYMKANNPDMLSYRQQLLESEKEVERTGKAAGFDASLSASVGFNQVGDQFTDAYRDLSRQDIARISVTIPIVDWGIKKGRTNMAKNNMKVTKLTVQQNEQELEQEVIATVTEFNKQQRLIRNAAAALEMAVSSYTINKQRFIVGKVDISTLTLSLNRRKEAQRNYILCLGNYWKGYYAIRKLTLFDFKKQENLTEEFERLVK